MTKITLSNSAPAIEGANHFGSVNDAPKKPHATTVILDKKGSEKSSVIYQRDITIQANEQLSTINKSVSQVERIERFSPPLFFSGYYDEQKDIIESLAQSLISNIDITKQKQSTALRALLQEVKYADERSQQNHQKTPQVIDHSLGIALRAAILRASELTNSGLASWEVYTKSDIPSDRKFLWPWLEQPKNWVYEAQACALKFSESTLIKAKTLASANPDMNHIVLYKGGFGAGKTSHAKQLFGEYATGVISPDKGKVAITKTMTMAHSTAHIEGSNISFNVYKALTHSYLNLAVYDSALAYPSDIQDALSLLAASDIAQINASHKPKHLKVIEVTRNDIARILSVLSRDVNGEDPRTPVGHILKGAVADRVNRANCMNVILSHNEEQTSGSPSDQHQYELHIGNTEKMGTTHILTVTPGHVEFHINQDKAEIELAKQGVRFNAPTQCFEAIETAAEWQEVLKAQFLLPVSELLEKIGRSEAEQKRALFSQRAIPFDAAKISFDKDLEKTAHLLYQAMKPSFKSALSEEAFLDALNELPEQKLAEFLEWLCHQISQQGQVPYTDLPFAVAAGINQRLQTNPFTAG